ncbi:TIGR04282 family arsenosugar biosynthesis glycosyltransferase [Falsiphaeobacter marinintestinus]|uniref:TIGR04282 family arsenosugar biosynthesis glycosyltransferase n=1 Tax=Falsiphaeobacter marinintestinus TaxID=1492905 RepID=UPI0011B5DDB0|nr:TIGR04282 family arsenosugar biosynthesis glycosyltransferase [Phaeobacter marinintestinus]
MSRPTLIIMVKLPRPGRVKTRLGRDVGMIPAAWWYRHQVKRLLRRLRDPRWQIVLAVSPDIDGLTIRVWPADLPRVPQGQGDLGQRMTGLLNAAPGPACLIGSDIPGVTRTHIARAFSALGAHQAVFGPASDGGYWLIGSKAGMHLPPLASVRWSSEHALSDSLAALKACRVALTDTLSDVDTAADLAP